MASLNLTTPWVEHYNKIEAFFKRDPEVKVIYDNDEKLVKLLVNNGEKAGALDAILPDEIPFGNVTLRIAVVPANGVVLGIPRSIFSVAFTGNQAVDAINTIEGVFSNPLTYIVFRKEVVQYYTDDLGDYYGMRSTLYEDIAREIFTPQEGILYSTNIDNPTTLDKPLGEWP